MADIKLQLGRTDVVVGGVIVAWIEAFSVEGSELHMETVDGPVALSYGSSATQCLQVVRQYMKPAKAPVLKLLHRAGSERSWADAHPEDRSGA